MDWTAITYLTYLATAIPLTVWVGHTLATHGTTFLADVFGDKQALATAVNRLLLVGFYLLNLGFVLLFLRTDTYVGDLTGLIEALSVKIGIVLVVVGIMHLANVLVFNAIRRKHLALPRQAPPAPPAMYYGHPYPAPAPPRRS